MEKQELSLSKANLTYEQLTPEQQEAVKVRIEGLRKASSQELLTYGIEAQTKVSQYANEMLARINATEKVEDIDSIIAEALDVSKGLTIVPEKKGFFQKMFGGKSRETPFDGSLFAGKVEKLVEAIELQVGRLMAENIMYDDFIDLLVENVGATSEMIAALDQYMAELKAIEEKAVVLDTSEIGEKDMGLILRSTERKHRIEQLARRANLFRISKQESMQVAVSARMIQNNNTVLSDRLQTLLVVGIPILQNQILLKASMADTQKGLDMSDKVAQSINTAMSENASQLRKITERLGMNSDMPMQESAVIDMSKEILSIANELKAVNMKTLEEVEQMKSQLQESDAALAEVFARLNG